MKRTESKITSTARIIVNKVDIRQSAAFNKGRFVYPDIVDELLAMDPLSRLEVMKYAFDENHHRQFNEFINRTNLDRIKPPTSVFNGYIPETQQLIVNHKAFDFSGTRAQKIVLECLFSNDELYTTEITFYAFYQQYKEILNDVGIYGTMALKNIKSNIHKKLGIYDYFDIRGTLHVNKIYSKRVPVI